MACVCGRPAGSQVGPVRSVTHRRCQLEGPAVQHTRMDLLQQRPPSPASCKTELSSLPNEVLCKIFANLHLGDRQVLVWFLGVKRRTTDDLAFERLDLSRLDIPSVCKAWSKLASEPTPIWNTIMLPSFDEPLDYFKVDRLFRVQLKIPSG